MHELEYEAGNLVRIAKSITPDGETVWTKPYLVLEVKAHGLMVLDDDFKKYFMPFRRGASGPVVYETQAAGREA